MLVQPFWQFREFLEHDRDRHRVIVRKGMLETFIRRLGSDDAKLSEESAPGFYTFLKNFRSQTTKCIGVKGQCVGPITTLRLFTHELNTLIEIPEAVEAISGYLTRHLLWQAAELSRLHETALLFLDEPMLRVEPDETASMQGELLKTAVRGIERAGAIAGIHSCARNASHVLFSDIGQRMGALIPSVDVSSPELLSDFIPLAANTRLGREPAVALGIVPTHSIETWSDSIKTWSESYVHTLLGQLCQSLNMDRSELVSKLLITPSCGLGTLSLAAATKCAELAQVTSELLRTGIGLDNTHSRTGR